MLWWCGITGMLHAVQHATEYITMVFCHSHAAPHQAAVWQRRHAKPPTKGPDVKRKVRKGAGMVVNAEHMLKAYRSIGAFFLPSSLLSSFQERDEGTWRELKKTRRSVGSGG